MADEDLHTLLAFFKAMANESRLRIVGLLAERERSVQELAETLGLSEPTVSHHLAALKAIGLVSVRPEGVVRWHALEPAALAELNRALLEPRTMNALAAPAESRDAKILSGFIDAEGRLKTIPASRRKRWVVLEWLMEAFEEGRDYPEAEVNARLQARHWDSATLRRELVGHGMMTRNAGVYRRAPRANWRPFDKAKPEG